MMCRICKEDRAGAAQTTTADWAVLLFNTAFEQFFNQNTGIIISSSTSPLYTPLKNLFSEAS